MLYKSPRGSAKNDKGADYSDFSAFSSERSVFYHYKPANPARGDEKLREVVNKFEPPFGHPPAVANLQRPFLSTDGLHGDKFASCPDGISTMGRKNLNFQQNLKHTAKQGELRSSKCKDPMQSNENKISLVMHRRKQQSKGRKNLQPSPSEPIIDLNLPPRYKEQAGMTSEAPEVERAKKYLVLESELFLAEKRSQRAKAEHQRDIHMLQEKIRQLQDNNNRKKTEFICKTNPEAEHSEMEASEGKVNSLYQQARKQLVRVMKQSASLKQLCESYLGKLEKSNSINNELKKQILLLQKQPKESEKKRVNLQAIQAYSYQIINKGEKLSEKIIKQLRQQHRVTIDQLQNTYSAQLMTKDTKIKQLQQQIEGLGQLLALKAKNAEENQGKLVRLQGCNDLLSQKLRDMEMERQSYAQKLEKSQKCLQGAEEALISLTRRHSQAQSAVLNLQSKLCEIIATTQTQSQQVLRLQADLQQERSKIKKFFNEAPQSLRPSVDLDDKDNPKLSQPRKQEGDFQQAKSESDLGESRLLWSSRSKAMSQSLIGDYIEIDKNALLYICDLLLVKPAEGQILKTIIDCLEARAPYNVQAYYKEVLELFGVDADISSRTQQKLIQEIAAFKLSIAQLLQKVHQLGHENQLTTLELQKAQCALTICENLKNLIAGLNNQVVLQQVRKLQGRLLKPNSES